MGESGCVGVAALIDSTTVSLWVSVGVIVGVDGFECVGVIV